MLENAFNEFAVLLSLTVLMGYIAIHLRQPLILSFIIVGIVAGPSVLGWISSASEIEVLASFGVTLLLFIVGLKLDLHLIKTFGTVALIIGAVQMAATWLLGFLLGIGMGMAWAPAFFIALAFTFSSTIIIIKVLSDRYEIDSLYGRIAVGVLIVQDVVVVFAIIILSSLSLRHPSHLPLPLMAAYLILKGVGLLLTVGLIMQFVFPWLLRSLAKSRELLILFAISWAVLLAVLGDALGFGKEVGGFIAGISLASTPYRETIASRLETLRNFLLLFFFLNLGASLEFHALNHVIWRAIAFSLFVLIAKPLIVMAVMGFMRFRKRISFMAGLTMGQISEFSLILAALGVNLGYINKNDEGLITFVGLITIGISTYLMAYTGLLYRWFKPWLNYVEREMNNKENINESIHHPIDVIIYGFGRHGEHIANILETYHLNILAIDFNPQKIRAWHNNRIDIRYGDAEDADFVKSLPLTEAKWVVSTVPHLEANRMLVSSLREMQYAGKIALSVYQETQLAAVGQLNVDMVLVPYQDAAVLAAERLAQQIRTAQTNAI